MSQRPPRIALAVALVALAAFVWTWTRARPSAGAPPPDESARPAWERGGAATDLARGGGPGDPADARVPAAKERSLAVDQDDLIAVLRRIGELRARVARIEAAGESVVPDEVAAELRELLEPIVHDEGRFGRVLGLLQSGELTARTRSGEPATYLSRPEGGGVWAASWTFCAHNGSTDLRRTGVEVDGRRTAVEIFVALVFLRPLAGDELARHLLRATSAGGRPILDDRFRFDLQGFVRMHPDVVALRTLLLGLIERLSALERLAALRDALEEDDPDRIRLEIAAHLDLGDVEHALDQAAKCLAGSQDLALRSRIAELVLSEVPDPFRATEFYVDQIEQLEIHPLAMWSLGSRPDSLPALEASYEDLKSRNADPRARLGLVNAMFHAPPEAMMEIARTDPADDVRALALARASTKEGGAPDLESLELLKDLSSRADLRSSAGIAIAAEALAQRSRRAGTPDEPYTNTLIDLARDPKANGRDRKDAVEKLKGLIPPESIQTLLGEIED